MTNFMMNCIFNAQSTDDNGAYVGSFNANYDNGNIYYNMNVMNAMANQAEVASDFDDFKQKVFETIAELEKAGFKMKREEEVPSTTEEPEIIEEEIEDGMDEPAL